jgi:hypothetical protein
VFRLLFPSTPPKIPRSARNDKKENPVGNDPRIVPNKRAGVLRVVISVPDGAAMPEAASLGFFYPQPPLSSQLGLPSSYYCRPPSPATPGLRYSGPPFSLSAITRLPSAIPSLHQCELPFPPAAPSPLVSSWASLPPCHPERSGAQRGIFGFLFRGRAS